jgi:hypothetical protein
MDVESSRGNPRGRGSTHARGERGRGRGGRGKATRARGAATRGMRVPPEYLQRVIAERQGRDPNALPDGDEDEDEDGEERDAREEMYRPRALGTNADRYKEQGEGGLVVGHEEDLEMASTYVFYFILVGFLGLG